MARKEVTICDNPSCGKIVVIEDKVPTPGITIESGTFTVDGHTLPFNDIYACTLQCLADAALNGVETAAKEHAEKPKRGRPKGSRNVKPATETDGVTVVINNPPALVEPEVKA